MWCGVMFDGPAITTLWSSKNMVDWRFISIYYNGTLDDPGVAVMTPDTFTFPSGESAFIWLGSKNTLWVTGNSEQKDGE